MSFHEHLLKDQRLVLLRLLSDLPGYGANSSVLTNLMRELLHIVSRDQVKTQLRWLEEQGLVAVSEPIPGILGARLLERGQECAQGHIVVPGVARPGA